MRLIGTFLIAAGLALPLAPAAAAERGSVIRASELKAKPFVDAATSAKLSANQAVSIVGRQGGWAQVEAGGTTGWVRVLNLRLQAGAANGRGSNTAAASLLRTGSSGRTVTTGIKGVDEEDIRNATPDMGEVEELASLAVDRAEAADHARQSGLTEHELAYLKNGGRK